MEFEFGKIQISALLFKTKTIHAMIKVMKFKAELVSKIDISFFRYESMHKTGNLLENMAHKPRPVILCTAVGDLTIDSS